MTERKGYALIHGNEKSPEKVLSAKDAFKDNNSEGLLVKEEFLQSVQKLRTEDYDHLDNLIMWLKEGLRMINSIQIRKDRGGMLYSWGKFARANGNEEVKIPAFPGILDLVTAYRDGKIIVDFCLDDLISEALDVDTSLT